MSQLDVLFSPLTIGHVTVRNRFLSTSHAPGYAVHGDIADRYVAYEEEKAKGGVGLVQFGGATAVSDVSWSPNSRQLLVTEESRAVPECDLLWRLPAGGGNRRLLRSCS